MIKVDLIPRESDGVAEVIFEARSEADLEILDSIFVALTGDYPRKAAFNNSLSFSIVAKVE